MSLDQAKDYASWAVVILLVGGGYYYWQNNPRAPMEQLGEEVSNTWLPGETITWQTYRSDEFGYEIQYPSDWEVIEYPENRGNDGGFNIPVSFYSPKNPASPELDNPNINHSSLHLLVFSVSDGETPEYVFGRGSSDLNTNINGVPAIRTAPRPVPWGGGGGTRVYENSLRSVINVIDGNVGYSLIGESYGPDYSASQEIIEQMFSSFRFLKKMGSVKPALPTHTAIYTNAELGLSFAYLGGEGGFVVEVREPHDSWGPNAEAFIELTTLQAIKFRERAVANQIGTDDGGPTVTIGIHKNPGNLSPREWVIESRKGTYRSPPLPESRDVTIAGAKGVFDFFEDCLNGSCGVWTLTHGERIYQVSGHMAGPDFSKPEPSLVKVLDTLKFVP